MQKYIESCHSYFIKGNNQNIFNFKNNLWVVLTFYSNINYYNRKQQFNDNKFVKEYCNLLYPNSRYNFSKK